MPISRLTSKWILGCATLGSLALLASQAGAALTNDHRQGGRDRSDAANSWEDRTAEVSRGIVRASSIDDRFLTNGERATARDSQSDRRWHATRGSNRPEHPLSDLPATFPDNGGATGGVSPIPEPGSVMLFAAGLGLIGLVARRKLL